MRALCLRWICGLVLAATPLTVSAQFVPSGAVIHPRCCREPLPVTTLQPVMQTQLRPQTMTSMVNVTETQYRTEQYLQSIPVTTLQNVTVDEGSYQTVWVPKLVTRQVPRTAVAQQVQTRTVPVQVTRQIPQTTTVLVPQQAVHYVPRLSPYAIAAPAPIITLDAPDFSSPSAAPAPASTADPSWQSVPQRKTSPASKSSAPLSDPAPMQRRTSSHTPTAARVWAAMSQPAPRTPSTLIGLSDR
jgi:hypothetical protein